MKYKERPVFEYLVVLFGSFLIALSLNWFLVPNQIAAGGVSGLATVVYYLTRLPVGVTMLFVNVPLFLISLKVLGPTFGVKTVVGAVATSVFVDVTAGWLTPLTSDPFLACIYGGVLSGIGIGVTFRVGGSTGGTDIAARLLHHWFRLGPGRMLMVADGFVIALAGIVFGAELALYAFIAVFLTGRVIDFIQEGGVYAKAAFIISTESDAIAQAVLHEMERGVTELKGQGMFTGVDRPVLFVIVPRGEIARLRRIVARIDLKAFMVVTDVSEVLGEGFREHEVDAV
ncbi:MAG: YitT family protein [Firmicutes bacterium]|nr:YitT family protein [Bacillota bacterium]